MSNIHYYLADPEVRKLSWQSRLASPAWNAKPNAGHLALVKLEKKNKLHALVTQNIDELHQLAGNSPDIIFLDVNLPSIKGNRLSEVLKSQSNKKDIPIVLISDLPEKSLDEMFPSSGANAWMRKPLTRDKMVDMINRFVK